MQKIRKGDNIIVITGRDKGKRGEVLRVMPKLQRIVVKGINIVKKHVRPNPQRNQQGGIVELETPIHLSNVALFNQATGKADKVGYKVLEDGRKVRYFKSNDEVIDV